MERIDIGKVNGITLNPDGTVRYISVTGRYYYSPQTRTVIVTDVSNDVAPSDLKGQEVFFRTSDGLRGHSFIKIYNNNKGETKMDKSTMSESYLKNYKDKNCKDWDDVHTGKVIDAPIDDEGYIKYLTVSYTSSHYPVTVYGDFTKYAPKDLVGNLVSYVLDIYKNRYAFLGVIDIKAEDDFKVGDRVLIKSLNVYGYILDVDTSCSVSYLVGCDKEVRTRTHNALQTEAAKRWHLESFIGTLWHNKCYFAAIKSIEKVNSDANKFHIGDRVIYNQETGVIVHTLPNSQVYTVRFDNQDTRLHSGCFGVSNSWYANHCLTVTENVLTLQYPPIDNTKVTRTEIYDVDKYLDEQDKKIQDEKDLTLLIRRKGNKVTCLSLGANDFAKGEAKCSPDDTFNFYTGASLALMRYLNNGGGKGNIE